MNSRFRKVGSWTATLTLIALGVGCSAFEQTQETSQSPDGASQKSASKPPVRTLPKSTHSVGELVSIQDKRSSLEFTVNGIREHKGKGVLVPNDGNKWILVKTTTTNKSQEPKTISMGSFALIDSKNNYYDVALLAGALEDVHSPTGELKPGNAKQGEVAFELPRDAKGLKLLFKPNSSDCQTLASQPKASEKVNCEPILVKLN
ncbi:MAG: DUF4352 domain-containing protein [Nostoc sp. C3-bin3]|nr:DUF4352 domain-containing protein [Nostoc sp. C3-bin3]